ncbi:MAG: TonB-dependent receptor [Myxococcales bacterium]|nr:TonB-dependent receptor [Myxococcales bacterium]
MSLRTQMSLRLTLASLCATSLLLGGQIAHAQEETPAAEGEAPLADEKLTPPVLINDVQPVYPQAAQDEGIAAEVVLNVDIDAAGQVENATVLQSAEATGYGFDEAAIIAARQLVFEPAKLGEQAIPVSISYRFRFVPDVKEEPAVVVPGVEKAPPPQPPPPTGQLSGQLTERGTRLPIIGVRVTIFRGEGDDAEGYETETDKDGAFLFEGLGVGLWRILADPEGYYPVRVEEEVDKDSRTKASYRIEKRSYNSYDVLVETAEVAREVSQVSISAKQAERIPGTFGDVLAVVQNFPGVARTQGAEVVVRGSAPEDTRVYIAGIDVPIIYHFGGLRSVLPVGMVERIDFYPGNFSVEYGRATGGIIDVDLKNLAPKKVGGYADVSILDTSLYLEVPINEKTAVAIAGRRSYIDVILGPLLPNDGTTFVLPRYYDAQILGSYRPDPAHRLETFFFYSDDKFKVLFDEPVGDDPNSIPITDVGFTTDFARAIASHHYVPDKKFSSELKLSVGQDRVNFNVGEELFIRYKSLQAQLRETAKYTLSDKLTLRGGVDYLLTNVDYSLRVPGTLPGEDDDDSDDDGPPILEQDDFIFAEAKGNMHSTAGFVQAEYKPIESLLLIPGLRLDHFSRTKNFAFSPRITARLELAPKWSIKGGAGVFVQEALFDESDPELGNPDLELEKAMHYSFGAEWRPRDHIKLEVTGFYKTLHDLVVPTDAVAEVDGGSRELRVNNGGAGRVIGLEVSARHELAKGLFGWVAYTLSKAERRDDGETEYRLFDYDQTHILTVIGSYKLPRNWEVSSRFRLVSGNLYTPYVGSVYSSDDDRYLGIRGETNSDRVNAFNQIDFRIDKKWVYDTWMLNAYLDIQNVANRTNPEGISYNFDFSETEVTSGLPIVPVLGLRGEF